MYIVANLQRYFLSQTCSTSTAIRSCRRAYSQDQCNWIVHVSLMFAQHTTAELRQMCTHIQQIQEHVSLLRHQHVLAVAHDQGGNSTSACYAMSCVSWKRHVKQGQASGTKHMAESFSNSVNTSLGWSWYQHIDSTWSWYHHIDSTWNRHDATNHDILEDKLQWLSKE